MAKVNRCAGLLGLLFGCLATLSISADGHAAPGQLAPYQLELSTAQVSHTQAPGPVDLSPYTVAAVRNKIPTEVSGQTAHLRPVNDLYFIPYSNRLDMAEYWQANKIKDPVSIVLDRGVYTLDEVYRQIDDPQSLAKDGTSSYILSRPLYISPNATLLIKAGEWLKLAVDDGVFITYNGTLFIVDAKISAWDKKSQANASRRQLTAEKALMYGLQAPRPYLLGMEGSNSYFANSHFTGLGYKGTSGTFGISFSSAASPSGIGQYLDTLAKPTGWLIGNSIDNLFFGFYTTNSSAAVIAGNEFRNNVIYAIDPHDYSDSLIIARNITYASQLAHGIIISREVNDSHIIENISFANAGSGIMLDRNCRNTLVAGNITFNNQGDGIAIFESDDNFIHNNTIITNGNNGLYVRNSLQTSIQENLLQYNAANGVEVASVNIDYIETRDFDLDPYHTSTSAIITGNLFQANINSALAVKSADWISLLTNRYQQSGPLYFSGDIEPIAASVLSHELNSPGQTLKLIRTTTDNSVSTIHDFNHHTNDNHAATPVNKPSTSLRVLRKLADKGNVKAMLALAEQDDEQSIYWYARSIQHARPSAMRRLGQLLIASPALSTEQQYEGVVFLTMAALLDDAKARFDLQLLPLLTAFTQAEVKKAMAIALTRLKNRQLWNNKAFPNIKVKLSGREQQLSRKRLLRAAATAKSNNKRRAAPKINPYNKDLRQLYMQRWHAKNAKKTARNLRQKTQQELDQKATGKRRAYLDRIQKRRAAAELRLSQWSAANQAAIAQQVNNMLQNINYHRDADSAITVQQLPLFSITPADKK